MSTYALDTHKSRWHRERTVPQIDGAQGPESDSPGDLLQLIRSGRARTRGELGEATGLARSTVAQRIYSLKAAGLIVESGEAAPSTGGRPPSLLDFNADAGLILAADLGATHSRVSVSNLLAESIAETSAEIEIDRGPEEVLSWLDVTFRDLLEEVGRPMSDVRGVGIGLPGPVDFARGMPVNPPIMAGWHMFGVADHCRALYGVPVLVDNDAVALANQTPFGLAAYVFGEEQHAWAVAGRIRTGLTKLNAVTMLNLNPLAPRPAWGLSGLGDEGTVETFEFFRGTRVIGVAKRYHALCCCMRRLRAGRRPASRARVIPSPKVQPCPIPSSASSLPIRAVSTRASS